MASERKPILCLDFDGVLHRYDSGWKGADVIPDPMTDGAAEFLARAVEAFHVAIFSSRSNQPLGIAAMQVWLRSQLYKRMDLQDAERIFDLIDWPKEKPPAMVTLDDRALRFEGIWPDIEKLKTFRTWQEGAIRAPSPSLTPHEDAVRRSIEKQPDQGDPVRLASMRVIRVHQLECARLLDQGCHPNDPFTITASVASSILDSIASSAASGHADPVAARALFLGAMVGTINRALTGQTKPVSETFEDITHAPTAGHA